MNEDLQRAEGVFAAHWMQLRKAVFSQPVQEGILRAEARPVEMKGERLFQLTTYMTDGKAIHQNYSVADAVKTFARLTYEAYRQTNLLTEAGDCQLKHSKKGKLLISNKIASDGNAALPAAHDHEKRYLIDAAKHAAFLSALGVCDQNGRIFDKKRAKYRQINRFLELLDNVYAQLPAEGMLTVCDLCCGKSYLTFAVYYYLTELKGRSVKMFGVDRKTDVIEFCSELASKLNCSGLTFLAMDIQDFCPPAAIDLVVSLHACDIATDIVLAYAVKQQAKVILSTPCCQHELFHGIKAPQMNFILRYSILGQKFCDAATDALRALRLEAEGYQTEVLELIDPEETPKNVMIRAVRTHKMTHKIQPHRKEAAMQTYRDALKLLGMRPMLDKLLDSDTECFSDGQENA